MQHRRSYVAKETELLIVAPGFDEYNRATTGGVRPWHVQLMRQSGGLLCVVGVVATWVLLGLTLADLGQEGE